MIGYVFRVLGLALLALAVAAIVVDAARSIAASAVTLTDIGPAWAALSPESLARVQEIVEGMAGSGAWGWASVNLLALPASVALAIVGFLFLLVPVRRRRRRLG